MTTCYIGNAFSLSMLNHPATVMTNSVPRTEIASAMKALSFTSVVGHESTAALISADLGVTVAFNRVAIKLNPGDELVVAQYLGPRLPEGATQLPEGARIDYILVVVH